MSDLIKKDAEPTNIQPFQPPPPAWYREEFEEVDELAVAVQRLRDFFFRVVVQHKWLIAAAVVTIVALTMLQTFTTTPVYRASLQLQIDPEYPNILPYQDVADSSFIATQEYLQSQIKALRSRVLARRVIERLNLTDHPVFTASTSPGLLSDVYSRSLGFLFGSIRQFLSGPPPAPSPEMPPDETQLRNLKAEASIPRLQGKLEVLLVPNSRILELSYSSHVPSFAVQVVEAVAEEFINLNLESEFQTTSSASEFLEHQLKDLQIKVERSEEALIQYARRNNILNYDERENMVLQKLSDLNREITRVESRLSAENARYEAVKHATVEDFPKELENSKIVDLQRRISGLQQNLATLSTNFGPRWPQVVQVQEQIDELTRQLDEEKRQAIELAKANHLTSLREHRNLLNALESQKRLADRLNENLIQYKILKREVDTNKELYEGLLQRMKEAGVSAGLKSNNIRVIDRSGLPASPSSPRPGLALLLSLFGGLLTGLGLAVGLTLLDNTVKTAEELETSLGLPSLGIIPTIRGLKHLSERREKTREQEAGEPREAAVIPYLDFTSRTWEPYRALRTSLLLSHSDNPPRRILVTSAIPSEGKSVTTVNLSIVLAQTGARTLLIDLDMRKPRLADIFNLNGHLGMSIYLSGNTEAISDIQQTAVPNLFVLTSGRQPPNPAELIGSRRMQEALQILSQKFDYIVIDSPPILSCTDAVVISPHVDGVILVARGGKSPKKAIKSAAARLWNVGAKILGVVLNDVDLERPEYSYYYRDYYQHYHYYDYDHAAR